MIMDNFDTIMPINGEMKKSIEYKKNSFLIDFEDDIHYLVMKKRIKFNTDMVKYENDYRIKIEDMSSFLSERMSYGSPDSFIVDMHGIKNFINARELDFWDSHVREMLIKLRIMEKSEYLRVGVSGATELENHPGGEVIENQIINGETGGGKSSSYSGYLKEEEGYSIGVPLSVNGIALEPRMVYSHTSFLKKNSKDNPNLYFNINCNKKLELIEHIKKITSTLNINAFSAQIIIKKVMDNQIIVRGRVLKRRPKIKFKDLAYTTEIGNEKVFHLKRDQYIVTFGTYYHRNDVDWFVFTEGREYEKKGHYHSRIINNVTENQHEVFHLRELNIGKNNIVELIITPINNIVKITPLQKIGEEYFCKVTNKCVDELIEEFEK